MSRIIPNPWSLVTDLILNVAGDVITEVLPLPSISPLKEEILLLFTKAAKKRFPKWGQDNRYVQQITYSSASRWVQFLIGEANDCSDDVQAVLKEWLILVNEDGSPELKSFVQIIQQNAEIKKAVAPISEKIELAYADLKYQVEEGQKQSSEHFETIISSLDRNQEENRLLFSEIKEGLDSLNDPKESVSPLDGSFGNDIRDFVKCGWDEDVLKFVSISFPAGVKNDYEPSFLSGFSDSVSAEIQKKLKEIDNLSAALLLVKGVNEKAFQTLMEEKNRIKFDIQPLFFLSYLSNILFAEYDSALSRNALWQSAKKSIDEGDYKRVLEILSDSSIEKEERDLQQSTNENYLTIAKLWQARAVALESTVLNNPFEKRERVCHAYDKAVEYAELSGMEPGPLFTLLINAAQIYNSRVPFEKDGHLFFSRSKNLFDKAIAVFEAFAEPEQKKHLETLTSNLCSYVDYARLVSDNVEAKSKYTYALHIDPTIKKSIMWALGYLRLLKQDVDLFSLSEREAICESFLSDATANLAPNDQVLFYEELIGVYKERGQDDLVKDCIGKCLKVFDNSISEYGDGTLDALYEQNRKGDFLTRQQLFKEAESVLIDARDKLTISSDGWDEQHRLNTLSSVTYSLVRVYGKTREDAKNIASRKAVLVIDRKLFEITGSQNEWWSYLQDYIILMDTLDYFYPTDKSEVYKVLDEALVLIDSENTDSTDPYTLWQIVRIVFRNVQRDFESGARPGEQTIQDCIRIKTYLQEQFYHQYSAVKKLSDVACILAETYAREGKAGAFKGIEEIKDCISFIKANAGYDNEDRALAKLYYEWGRILLLTDQPISQVKNEVLETYSNAIELYEKVPELNKYEAKDYINTIFVAYTWEGIFEMHEESFRLLTKAAKYLVKMNEQFPDGMFQDLNLLIVRLYVHLIMSGRVFIVDDYPEIIDIYDDIAHLYASFPKTDGSIDYRARIEFYGIVLEWYDSLYTEDTEEMISPKFFDWLKKYEGQSELIFSEMSVNLFLMIVTMGFDKDEAIMYGKRVLELAELCDGNSDYQFKSIVFFANNLVTGLSLK